MTNDKSVAVVILAAGKGTRMNNPDLPKVLAPLSGKPLIGHVLKQADKLNPDRIVVVVGHKQEKVRRHVDVLNYQFLEYVEQHEQLGTGHAVDRAAETLEGFEGNVLILCGDVPLLTSDTLVDFIENHEEEDADISVLSTIAEDPTGYGRIIRDEEYNFVRISEEKDANEEEKKIVEVNSGVYFAKTSLLFSALKDVKSDNTQGEYYLTDIIDILKKKEYNTVAYAGADFDEVQGINSVEDLEKADKYYRRSITKRMLI